MKNMMTKLTVLLLFIAMLCNLMISCADTGPSDEGSAKSATTTTAPATTYPWDIWDDWDGQTDDIPVPEDLESPYYIFYFEAAVGKKGTEKYDDLPNGYTHPEGTHSFYIDHSVYLPEDFYRPDLIWGIDYLNGIGENYLQYVRGFSYTKIVSQRFLFNGNYPDAKYAIAIEKGSAEFNQAFKKGVMQLGWEFVCDRENEMVFAAALDEIVWLGTNFDDFQKQAGYDFERVVFAPAMSDYVGLYTDY